MNKERSIWAVTVAKSGVVEVEAESEDEAMKVVEEELPTTRIQWEDAWNIVDIDKILNE